MNLHKWVDPRGIETPHFATIPLDYSANSFLLPRQQEFSKFEFSVQKFRHNLES